MELKSKFLITRDEDHNYTVIDSGGKAVILDGVTGILDIVGSKDKTNRLMGWAKKQALLKVAEHLRAFAKSPVDVTEEWIESVRKSAWKKDRAELVKAGDIGTRVHAAIDAYILGKMPVLDADTQKGFNNFMAWVAEAGITLARGDTYVASVKYGFGGALDALGVEGKKIILCDWKTGNGLYDTSYLQSGAYAIALEETFGVVAEGAYVVRFGKEIPGDIEIQPVDLIEAKVAFMSALELHKKMKERRFAIVK